MTDSRQDGARGFVTALGVQLALFAAQLVIGIVVNLYAPIPAAHPGSASRGGGYFANLGRVIPWALTSGPATLAAHVALGLALIAIGIVLVVLAVRAGGAGGITLSSLGLAFTIGAAFNGGSFLIFGNDDNLSSLIMGILFTAAAASYVLALVTALRRPAAAVHGTAAP
ncbi:MAG TPA: hypothetical protein VKV80_07020 [Streptosporangiaceae bacterium]|nr:hypothetical protein [Streptosporangiaceae bacterium]